jgi:antitoxin CptB
MDAGADAERKRLRWRCRRGMRELDVLLERYLAEVWPGAGEAQRRAFAALLDWPDPELAALLFGRRTTTDPEIAAVVAASARLRAGEAPGGEAAGGGPAGPARLLES